VCLLAHLSTSFGAHREGFSIIEEESLSTASDLRPQIHTAVFNPLTPQLAHISTEVHTSSTPPHAVVRSRNSSIWSEIELSIPSPSFHTHITPDPTVTSDWSDNESTEPGTPSQLTLSNFTTPLNLSSFTPLGPTTPTSSTPATPSTLTAMTTPPRMPVRGQNSAPKFEGTAASLNRFFANFEYLATISGLGDPEKKKDIVQYLSTEEADFWKQQAEWQSNATFLKFKEVIFKAYPGSEATDRTCISDMDALVGATQHIGIHTLAEFSEFYRKFSTIIVYLKAQNRIGNREISTNFLRALPADLQHKINFCIQIKELGQHVDMPHKLQLLFNASVHVLSRSTILDTLNLYAAAAAYAQPNPAQQHGAVPPGYPLNVYNPSASTPYGYQPPPAAPGAQYNPFVQATVPVTPQPPPGGSAYQPLAYGPGLKTEDILNIATTVALEFVKQLTLLFQQQSHGNAAPNSGQNWGTFTCAFCGQPGHGI
jgi:hypothetical protein